MDLRAHTPEADRIWADVEKAARRCPEWAKPLVEAAARNAVEQIAKREEAKQRGA